MTLGEAPTGREPNVVEEPRSSEAPKPERRRSRREAYNLCYALASYDVLTSSRDKSFFLFLSLHTCLLLQ
jgi:hypothetical protein